MNAMIEQDRLHIILLWLMLIAYGLGIIGWLHLDTTPPMFDQSVILKESLHYYDLLKEQPLHKALWKMATDYPDYYPPFVPYIAAGLYFIFGNSSHTAVLAVLPFLGLLSWAIYAMGRFLWGSSAGLLAVFLVLTSPMIIGHSREFLLDLPLSAMVAAGLYFLIRSRDFEDNRYSTITGVILGLGMLTKWALAFFMIGPMILIAVRLFGRTWSRWKDRVIAGIAATLMFGVGIVLHASLTSQVRMAAKVFLYIAAVSTAIALWPTVGRYWGKALSWKRIPLLKGANENVRPQWSNFFRVLAIAIILSGPWYFVNIGLMRADLTHYATEMGPFENHPDVLSVPSVMFHFWDLINFQLFLPFALLAFAGILWASWSRPAGKNGAIIMSAFVSGWIILTLIANKNPRYSLPLIAPALLLGSAWVVSRPRILRYSLSAALIVVGLIQYGAVRYDYGPIHETVSVPLPKSSLTEFRDLPAQMVIYSTATKMYTDLGIYYSHPPLKEHWPLEEILDRTREEDPDHPPVLVVAYFDRFLNTSNLFYLGQRIGSPVKVLDVLWKGFDQEPRKWAGRHYLLTRMDDPRTTAREAALRETFPDLDARVVQTWRLPNQTVIQLLCIQTDGISSSAVTNGKVPAI